MSSHPLRVAIIGTAKRSDYLYGSLIKALPEDVELVSVWGRSADSVERLGKSLGVPAYTSLDKLVRKTVPEIGVVSVNYHANGEVGLMAAEAGLHVLLETPIAHKLSEADAIIQAAAQRQLKIEVSEQFHRRPPEQLKLKLIASGLFGRVHTSFNDFAGHGYHGISVMRSYLGFDARPLQVTGTQLQLIGRTIHEAGFRLFPNAERYLKSPSQMHRLFSDYPPAIRRGLAGWVRTADGEEEAVCRPTRSIRFPDRSLRSGGAS